MLTRTLIRSQLIVTESRGRLNLDVERRYVESSIGAGKIVYENDRYEDLTTSELAQVLEMEIETRVPGGTREHLELGDQLSMFA